jgi:4-amino-4-deoxy-L-arabinose transferase-like glycosyltransferase
VNASVTFRPITHSSRLKPFRALILVTFLWAGIYLPGLGFLQLHHEEPRRALPALHMLASGDWLVPRVGADPYLRKPPLLNWAIALSCKLSGDTSEWAVRLPSVLATLALAITIVGVGGGRWLGFEGGLIAAIFFLTNFTMIESGRMAELEALYVSLTGIALILWMTAWRQGVGGWQLWLFPAPFLALGMLTKGPTHLIFYYGIILPVLVLAHDTRSLRHPAHFFSLTLVLGALLCWAIPCSLAASDHNPVGAWNFWWVELASRASAKSGENFTFSKWLLNGPQTLKNYLPWTLLLPVLWRKETVARRGDAPDSGPRELALFRGARWGMVATCTLMILLPNGSPRYIYPLIVIPCLLLGRALTVNGGSGNPVWLYPIWRRANFLLLTIVSLGIVAMPFAARGDHWAFLWTFLEAILSGGVWLFALANSPSRPGPMPAVTGDRLAANAITSGAVAVLGMMLFASVALPRINSANPRRPREMAVALRQALPPDVQLWVLEDKYRPFWYYLEPNVRYFHRLTDLPPQAHYILVPAARTKSFLQDPGSKPVPSTVLIHILDSENRPFDLIRRR